MNLLAKLRTRKRTWGARATGLFAIVWLNLALQPCVMAFETAHEGDCPHCPPSIAEHHGAHGMAHEMATIPTACASGTDCGPLDDFKYDGRDPKAKVEQPQGKLVALIPPLETGPARTVPCRLGSTPATDHLPGASPPTHVLNCVYLN